MRLQRKAEGVLGEIFLGGPVELFEVAGRLQLILLLRGGVEPGSKVLDVGCGCLRAGYWLIHFLSPGCYFGIEPNEKMLETGIREFLEPGVQIPKFRGQIPRNLPGICPRNPPEDLRNSVRERIRQTERLGRDRPHGQRQGAEQDLIEAIEKYLNR